MVFEILMICIDSHTGKDITDKNMILILKIVMLESLPQSNHKVKRRTKRKAYRQTDTKHQIFVCCDEHLKKSFEYMTIE